MTDLAASTHDDVQARRPDHAREPLARRRDRRREGHPDPARTAREQLFYAELECFVDLGPAPEGRAHVALRGGRQRGDRRGGPRRGLQGRDARRSTSPSACATARTALRAEVTIAARYPEHKLAPVSGSRDAGDLHAVRLGGGVGARHAPADRRRGPGHDRLPVRAGAGDRRARASGWRPTASPTTRSSACFARVPVATHNQRGIGRLYVGCPEGCDRGDRGRRRCCGSSRVDELGDLRADEAQRRGRGGREGAHAPALRGGLRARDGAHGRRRVRRASATTRSCSRARRTSRRSTATTWWPSATACSASSGASCPSEIRCPTT